MTVPQFLDFRNQGSQIPGQNRLKLSQNCKQTSSKFVLMICAAKNSYGSCEKICCSLRPLMIFKATEMINKAIKLSIDERQATYTMDNLLYLEKAMGSIMSTALYLRKNKPIDP